MQAIGTPLPKFKQPRHQPIPTPVRWTRDVPIRVLPFRTREACLQMLAPSDNAALTFCPHRKSAPYRPTREVGIRFPRRHLFNNANAPHLPVQLTPIEDKRGVRIFGELPPFLAVIIGIEAKPLLIKPSEDNHPGRRNSVRRCCRQCHRIGQVKFGDSIGEPFLELLKRLFGGVFLNEPPVGGVFSAKFMYIHKS